MKTVFGFILTVFLILVINAYIGYQIQHNNVKASVPKILSVDKDTKTVILDYGDFTRVVYKDGECCDFGNENTEYENGVLGNKL